MTKFHEKDYNQRLSEITNNPEVFLAYKDEPTQKLTENYLTGFNVPVGVVRKLTVNNKDYIVPIATEEPSVVAAANKGAKLLGNIEVHSQTPMLRRAQILTTQDPFEVIDNHHQEIFEIAENAHPSIVERGGGLEDISVRELPNNYFSVDLLINTKDAMGANIVNTIAEAIAAYLAEQNIQVLTAIVSNNSTESLVTAEATIEIDDEIAYKIAQLSEIAQLDPYRAVTDNKGFLNGASGVVQATGNDYRAFEAGVHAYAVAFGQYQSVTKWTAAGGVLKGITTIPVMVGILGGTIGVHPVAQANLKLLDVQSGDELASVIAATGLAQNFAALYALVTTGIQSGHMKLHNKAVNKETND